VKRYDRRYFDRWYRSRKAVNSTAEIRRKVAMTVAVAEFFLHNPVRNVLDVGCGEGAWLPHLRALRPNVAYSGVDPSEYVVERFGKQRNIRQASFGGIASLRIREQFDLIVCADALHYVPDDEIRRGLPELVRLARGTLFLEVLTSDDRIVGDLDSFIRRPASWYRRVFRGAGLTPVAPYSWASPEAAENLAALEIPSRS